MATLRLAEPWCRAQFPRLLAVFVAVTALAAQQRKLLTVHGDQPSFPDVVSTTWCSSGLRVRVHRRCTSRPADSALSRWH